MRHWAEEGKSFRKLECNEISKIDGAKWVKPMTLNVKQDNHVENTHP